MQTLSTWEAVDAGFRRLARRKGKLTICERCEAATVDAAGDEVPVTSAVVAQARCDANHLGRTHVGEPERAAQDPAPAVRRLVLARDHHRCTVPGCRSNDRIEVHHIDARAAGGGHEPANLTTLCHFHHAALHNGRLRIDGRAPDLAFFHGDGAPYGSHDRDAASALKNLGYSAAQARTAVAAARNHVGVAISLEGLIRQALRAAG